MGYRLESIESCDRLGASNPAGFRMLHFPRVMLNFGFDLIGNRNEFSTDGHETVSALPRITVCDFDVRRIAGKV